MQFLLLFLCTFPYNKRYRTGGGMMLERVAADKLQLDVFSVFGTNNGLLMAGDTDDARVMTVGWANLGRTWNIPTCIVYVRPERYTYEYMETHEYFSLSVLPMKQHDKVIYCGIHSGRDTDKIKDCDFSLQYGMGDTPLIDTAEWALVCKKLYVQDLSPQGVTDSRVLRSYTREGWHRMYIGQVVEAYRQKTE
jgi:flavin reductase (DIM6/NTAB) family NADH-FMN oxidoreductase RutF